jgi:putative ABC transport system substrate-binding protein
MNPKLFWLITAFLLAFLAGAEAQQPKKIARIGYVSGTGNATDQGPYVEALRQGLRDLGHVEGKTFIIEYRGAEGKLDQIPMVVNDLVQLKVDVLVVPIVSAARAAKQATKSIPIVMITGDPLADRVVDSLARPQSNLTGLATLTPNLGGKRLELLMEVIQRLFASEFYGMGRTRAPLLLNTKLQRVR